MQPITTITSPYYEKYQLRPYNPAELFQKFGDYKVYDEMRTDDQISANLELQKSLMINCGHQIVCPDYPEVAEFITWNLEEINFESSLFEMFTGMDYGFSLTEKVFSLQSTKWGDKIAIESLATRAPHTFEFKQDDYGKILLVKQYGGGEKGADLPLPPDKFIHYMHLPEFGNPYGNSAMNRGVYTAWWSKKAIIKFWNIYLERFGMPLAIGKYSKGASEEIRRDFISSLKNLQSKTSMVLPEGFEVEFIEATTGGTGFREAINTHNMLICRKMQMPDLLGYGGSETAGGSYALGENQMALFYQCLERPRRAMQRLLNIQLIRPLVELNYGPGIDCELQFKPMSEAVMMEKVKSISDAYQKGALTKQDSDEEWFRAILGMPDREKIELAPTVDPMTGLPIQTDGFGVFDPSQPMVQQQQQAPNPEPMAYAEKKKPELRKPRYDAKVNYTQIKSFLDECQEKVVKDIGLAISKSVNSLISKVREKNIVGKASLWSINALQLNNWDAVRMGLKRGLKCSLDEGWIHAEGEVGQKKDNMIKGGKSRVSPEAYLNDMAHTTSEKLKAEILGKIQQQLKSGVKSGLSQSEVLAKIDADMAQYDVTHIHGYAEQSPSRLETIARTTTMTAYNEGRLEYFQSEPDLIQGYEYSAVMDERTTDECAALNGETFRPEDGQAYNPPRHYNCRSILVPITIVEEKPQFSNKDDLPLPGFQAKPGRAVEPEIESAIKAESMSKEQFNENKKEWAANKYSKLTEFQKDSYQRYTDFGFDSINTAAREGKKNVYLDDIKKIIKKQGETVKTPLIVYRDIAGDFAASMKEGMMFKDAAPISTGVVPRSGLLNAHGRVNLAITVEPGAKYIYGTTLENELIFQPGPTFKIIAFLIVLFVGLGFFYHHFRFIGGFF